MANFRYLSLLATSAALFLTGCRAQHDDPAEAYAAFSSNLKRHDLDAAYRQLSTPTQKAFEARAKELALAACPPGAIPAESAGTDGTAGKETAKKESKDESDKNKPRCTVKTEPQLIAMASGVKVVPLGSIRVVEKSADTAVLEIGGPSTADNSKPGETGAPGQPGQTVQTRQKMIKEADGWRVDLAESLK